MNIRRRVGTSSSNTRPAMIGRGVTTSSSNSRPMRKNKITSLPDALPATFSNVNLTGKVEVKTDNIETGTYAFKMQPPMAKAKGRCVDVKKNST
jgi:hypothetical protein